jgi:hypothetical protein
MPTFGCSVQPMACPCSGSNQEIGGAPGACPAPPQSAEKVMARRNNRFRAGSGYYVCKVCHKGTRETGEGESSVRMCRLCYFKSGWENSLSDGGHPNPWGIFDDCRTEDEVVDKYELELAKLEGEQS